MIPAKARIRTWPAPFSRFGRPQKSRAYAEIGLTPDRPSLRSMKRPHLGRPPERLPPRLSDDHRRRRDGCQHSVSPGTRRGWASWSLSATCSDLDPRQSRLVESEQRSRIQATSCWRNAASKPTSDSHRVRGRHRPSASRISVPMQHRDGAGRGRIVNRAAEPPRRLVEDGQPTASRSFNPLIDPSVLLGASFSPRDGYAQPGQVVHGYADAGHARCRLLRTHTKSLRSKSTTAG